MDTIMDYLSETYIGLYNAAISKIFEPKTMTQIFGQDGTTDLIGNNIMRFKVTNFEKYNLAHVQGTRNFTEKKAKEEYTAMAQQRENFVVFMKSNFPEITNSGVSGASTLQAITQNVTKFIGLMEVKPKFPIKGEITIEVTLHDIIDKLASTSFESEHCKSEKIFMAILLAILMLHYPTPRNEYKLVFKFAKSLFGKSGLQKSSITCSGNKTITESMDPVATNDTTIFGLDTSELKKVTPETTTETKVVAKPLQPLTLKPSETPPPLSPPVGENVGSIKNDSPSQVSAEERRAADYKLMENRGQEIEYHRKSEPLKKYIYSKKALDAIPKVSPTNVAYTKYETERKKLTATIEELSSKFNIQSLEDAKKKLAELEAAAEANTSDVEPPPPPAEAKASDVEAAEANTSDVEPPPAPETPLLLQAQAQVEAEEEEELQPTPLTGDELFEKMMKGEDPSPEEKDTYQKIVLQKFKKGNYQVKRIEKWDYKSVSEELKKSEGFRSEVLDLLSITPNGDVYGKLSYLVNIFYSLNCKDNDCLKIYLITAALLPFFHTQGGGSKSRRRHRRKPVRKSRRKPARKTTRKSKSKPKTHRRRRHSRTRKHKKYTSRRR
jgi:hypothetical protein